MKYSVACNKSFGELDIVSLVTNEIILPTEMICGMGLQILNLAMLHRNRIKGLGYTIYLQALSLTYILTTPFLIPALIKKTGNANPFSYLAIFYHAHMEQYFINVFLFAGNFIIICLGLEPLKSLMCPFRSLQRTACQSYALIAGIYAFVLIILLPTTILKRVVVDHSASELTAAFAQRYSEPASQETEDQSTSGTTLYCVTPTGIPWISMLRYVSTVLFESCLIACIVVVYFCLLWRFRHVSRKHRHKSTSRGNSKHRALSSGTLVPTSTRQRNQKATTMCLGSMTGFLICTIPSATLETVYLIAYYTNTLNYFSHSPARYLLINVANIMLMLNSSLTFIMQCIFSYQYRRELYSLVLRRPPSSQYGSVRYSSVRTVASFGNNSSLRHFDRSQTPSEMDKSSGEMI